MTDLQLGREKQQAFDEWLNTKEKKLPLDLSVTVLTTGGGCWLLVMPSDDDWHGLLPGCVGPSY